MAHLAVLCLVGHVLVCLIGRCRDSLDPGRTGSVVDRYCHRTPAVASVHVVVLAMLVVLDCNKITVLKLY